MLFGHHSVDIATRMWSNVVKGIREKEGNFTAWWLCLDEPDECLLGILLIVSHCFSLPFHCEVEYATCVVDGV